MARETSIGSHIELSKDVTGRESHLLEIGRVPGTHENATACRVLLDLLDDISKLIDTLAFVVIVHGLVRGTEVSPLETIDGAQIPFFPLSEADFIEELS